MRKTVLLFLALACLNAAAQDGWTITTSDFKAETYYGDALANGQLGILPWREPFSVRDVTINHVFEYYDAGHTGCNAIIEAPIPFGLSLKVDGKKEWKVSDWSQTVDMRRAMHQTHLVAGGKARINYEFVALRNLPNCLLMQVSMEALKDCELAFTNTPRIPDNFKDVTWHFQDFKTSDETPMLIQRVDAKTKFGRHGVSMAASFMAQEGVPTFEAEEHEIHFNYSLKKGEKASFAIAASIITSQMYSDYISEVQREVIYIRMNGLKRMLSLHQEAWNELWEGDIEIEGDPEAQLAVRSALYHLYASCRHDLGLSPSPMGLTSRGYYGHVFWDTEIWMYPAMLLMNQGIAQSMLQYRLDRLDGARVRATSYGYKGVMFPWESEGSGQEATPPMYLTGPLQHHITADIAIAAWNSYQLTRDEERLLECWPLLKGVAEFWESRVTKNADGSYSILNVVGADEYAQNVDDNAFTNGAAKVAMQDAVKAAQVLGRNYPPEWEEIARNIVIPVKDGITQDYAGYNGHETKQADPNLLAYPLGLVTDPTRIRADLAYYDSRLDPYGPAMTWGMFTVQYARLGDARKAEEYFRRSYRPNQQPPFHVFTETANSTNPYFITGAGALLQAVLYGFGGLYLTDDGLVQKPSVLPASWKKLTLKGIGPSRQTFIVENK